MGVARFSYTAIIAGIVSISLQLPLILIVSDQSPYTLKLNYCPSRLSSERPGLLRKLVQPFQYLNLMRTTGKALLERIFYACCKTETDLYGLAQARAFTDMTARICKYEIN
jgi:hypothetical protein